MINKNIYKQEFRSLLKPLSFWTLILSLTFLFFFAIYPLYIANQNTLLIIFKSYPPFVLEFLGINLDTCFTPIGYYSFVFKYISIIAALEAAMIGARIVTSDRSNSFLYTLPLKRNTILSSKILAGLSCLAISHIIYQIISFIIMHFLTGVDYKALFLINISLIMMQITFASIIMMIASFIKNKKTVSIISYVSIASFYLLSIIENSFHNKILRYINPFSYFKISDILAYGKYNQSFIVATIFIVFYTINFSFIHNNELEM